MDIQLTKREHNILLHLLTTTRVTTTQELADLFETSVRTIKYDVENIRYWLKNRRVELSSRRGKGIWIDLPDSKKISLKNEVLKQEKLDLSVNQEKRLNKIAFELLVTEDYMTSEEISHIVQVSKNTVLSDLDKVEHLLNANNLILIRQNRKGFKIEGSEMAIRLLLEKIIQNEVSDYDIYHIMSKLVSNDSQANNSKIYIGLNEEFQKIYDKTLNHMVQLVDGEVFEGLNYSELLSITIRTAISVNRLLHKKTIGNYRLLPEQSALQVKKDFPYLLVYHVYDEFVLPVLEDEYHYIYTDVFNENQNKDFNTITENIIKRVSEILDFPFQSDGVLFTNLFAHLSLRLSKKHLYINEYNPFVVDIKAKYPQLFHAIEKACQEEIDGATFMMNESFIAYISLHFLVSAEKYRDRDSIKVVYVCSTGLGVTSLIQQKIQEEVTNVEVVSFASILNLREVVEEQKPELLISIFPVEEMNIPWIKVNPIPSEEDIKRIQKIVDSMMDMEHKTFTHYKIKPRNKAVSGSKAEEESREIIVKGFIVFEELKKLFGKRIEPAYIDSFLLHVFLMVHRIEYNAQYVNDTVNYKEMIHENKEISSEIENVFAKNNLAINHSEIVALLQYIKKDV